VNLFNTGPKMQKLEPHQYIELSKNLPFGGWSR
jgi:hypothetical protein